MPARLRWIGRALVAPAIALTMIGVTTASPASAALPPPPVEPQPRAWILVDVGSGDVLGASNERELMLVASTVKLMTALTALQHLPTDATLTVSERAAARPAITMGMEVGQQWPLLHVLSSALIVSANDAAYVLAESSAGSVDAFAEQMTATATRLGLQDSTFSDPSGLDDEQFSSNGGSQMSAYDLAITGRNALAVPAIAERAATTHEQFEDPTGTVRSLNTKNSVFLGQYDGATGLKTGNTDAAGSTLVASATRDGRTLLAVVLGVPDTAAWAGSLLDQGFSGQATGTDATLPPVAAVTADQTRAALAGMPLLLGRSALELTAAPESIVAQAPTEPTTPTSAPPEEPPPTTAPAEAGAGEDGTNWVLLVGLVGLAVLVALVVLRRRAVMRRRRRRYARQRALAEARRRGMIDVIDPNEVSRGRVMVRRERSSSR